MSDLCFLDVETTGLSPRRHEVIDIWARRVRADTLELVAEAGGLVLPVRIEEADERALEINGFDAERWAVEARPWAEVWGEVEQVLDGAQLVGQNPAFDVRMVNATCERDGLDCGLTTYHAVDTTVLAHPLHRAGMIESVSLGALVEHFGVEVEALAHSARGDVLRTVEVYRRMMGIKETEEDKR